MTQQYANGGIITGPDPTPILGPCGYMLSARQIREIGLDFGFLAKLNDEYRP